ncbi:MAG: methyltransferase domain-containing protein [Terriglobia bacterium]
MTDQKGAVLDKNDRSVPSDLPPDVRAILRCPQCHGSLQDAADGLRCPACGRDFPVVKGVMRFVGAEQYTSSFGFQWNRHPRTQLDDEHKHQSEAAFRERTGFTPEELAGKLVLDVGCGMGRFAEVASRWGARVVGIDLSQAVEAAAWNLKERESVTILQADVFSLPFAPESFDFIYSIGVLHHTPDCEKAFISLPPFLKPGGSIAIWLYSGYNKWYRFSDIYRKVTHRMPPRLLHALAHIAVPLYYVHRGLRVVPIVGRPVSGLIKYVLPMSQEPDADQRVLDTFDWYSPKYQSKHTYEEVFRWFESCRLDSLRVIDSPISVRGHKPDK